jgi:hypothetical protein
LSDSRRPFFQQWVDVGRFDRNVDLAESYRVPLKMGSPAVAVLADRGAPQRMPDQRKSSAVRRARTEDRSSMTSLQVLYPAIAMFALTMACVFALGLARYRAIRKGEVRLSFFRTYDEGSQPKRLHLLARHVQNHFEVPPLFHVGVVLVHATQSASAASIGFAWLFVVSRIVHSSIHLGTNNVTHRFFAYGFGLLMLCGLWASLLVSLLTRPA